MDSQRRWDTSPYRRVHALNWAKMNRAKWPAGGSLAWRPKYAYDVPLPQRVLLPTLHHDAHAAPSRATESAEGEPELLHRLLERKLCLSAADALALVQRHRVIVSGRLQKRDRWVRPGEAVDVNGHSLEQLSSMAVFAHKPVGVALTEEDPLRRPTYVQLLPHPSFLAQPAGRLDIGSSGLLLLTNRRDLAEAFSWNLPAEFSVRLHFPLLRWQLSALRTAAPYGVAQAPDLVEATYAESGHWPPLRAPGEAQSHESLPSLRVVLREGRPQHLRQALERLGVQAEGGGIACTRVGPMSLEGLGLEGAWDTKPASEAEVAAILGAASPEGRTR